MGDTVGLVIFAYVLGALSWATVGEWTVRTVARWLARPRAFDDEAR